MTLVQESLFPDFVPASPVDDAPIPPDLYTIAAHKVCAGVLPDGWRWFAAEVIAAGRVLLEGAVPLGLHLDGSPRWPKGDGTKVVVTPDDVNRAAVHWETLNGKCSLCAGSRREWAGWSKAGGRMTRPCTRCRATGLPPHTLTEG